MKTEMNISQNQDVHFIWIGGIIPEDELENIKGWPELNPDYNFNLWYDSGLTRIKMEEYQKIIGSGIILRDVTSYNLFTDSWLKFAYETESGLRPRSIYKLKPPLVNYGLATDILRLLILKRFKGLYIDVDIVPIDLSMVNLCNLRLCFAQISNTLSNAVIYYDGLNDSSRAMDTLLGNLRNLIRNFYLNRQIEYPFNWEQETLNTTGPIAINQGLIDYKGYLFGNDIFLEDEQLGREHTWFIRLSKFLDLFVYIYQHPEIENKLRLTLGEETKQRLYTILDIDVNSVKLFEEGNFQNILESLLSQEDLEDEEFISDLNDLYDEYMSLKDPESNFLRDLLIDKVSMNLSRDNKELRESLKKDLDEGLQFDYIDDENKERILRRIENILLNYS